MGPVDVMKIFTGSTANADARSLCGISLFWFLLRMFCDQRHSFVSAFK